MRFYVHMECAQPTRELCPESVRKHGQLVSENAGLDGLGLQELMGLLALGVLWVSARDDLQLHLSYKFDEKQ